MADSSPIPKTPSVDSSPQTPSPSQLTKKEGELQGRGVSTTPHRQLNITITPSPTSPSTPPATPSPSPSPRLSESETLPSFSGQAPESAKKVSPKAKEKLSISGTRSSVSQPSSSSPSPSSSSSSGSISSRQSMISRSSIETQRVIQTPTEALSRIESDSQKIKDTLSSIDQFSQKLQTYGLHQSFSSISGMNSFIDSKLLTIAKDDPSGLFVSSCLRKGRETQYGPIWSIFTSERRVHLQKELKIALDNAEKQIPKDTNNREALVNQKAFTSLLKKLEPEEKYAFFALFIRQEEGRILKSLLDISGTTTGENTLASSPFSQMSLTERLAIASKLQKNRELIYNFFKKCQDLPYKKDILWKKQLNEQCTSNIITALIDKSILCHGGYDMFEERCKVEPLLSIYESALNCLFQKAKVEDNEPSLINSLQVFLALSERDKDYKISPENLVLTLASFNLLKNSYDKSDVQLGKFLKIVEEKILQQLQTTSLLQECQAMPELLWRLEEALSLLDELQIFLAGTKENAVSLAIKAQVKKLPRLLTQHIIDNNLVELALEHAKVENITHKFDSLIRAEKFYNFLKRNLLPTRNSEYILNRLKASLQQQRIADLQNSLSFEQYINKFKAHAKGFLELANRLIKKGSPSESEQIALKTLLNNKEVSGLIQNLIKENISEKIQKAKTEKERFTCIEETALLCSNLLAHTEDKKAGEALQKMLYETIEKTIISKVETATTSAKTKQQDLLNEAVELYKFLKNTASKDEKYAAMLDKLQSVVFDAARDYLGGRTFPE